MLKNLDKYKADLERLLTEGEQLLLAMVFESSPEQFEESLSESLGDKYEETVGKLPKFSDEYQSWYSEAKALVRQLLPDRLGDLDRHYHKPKPRKDLTNESYRIEDYLQGLNVTRWNDEQIVGKSAAIPHFQQQIAILKSVKKRFDSSLFDIRQLVKADLLDSELDAAKELHKNGFWRAAGAVAGVVLEKHLAEVCSNHVIKFRKKRLTISDYNDALKKQGVIGIPEWRSIQYLGDLRNLCDHDKEQEPTKDQVKDLIDGAAKTTKTLF